MKCKFILAFLLINFLLSGEEGFVFVEGGSFQRGITGSKDTPLSTIIVSSFYIAQSELTVGQWKKFVNSTKSNHRWEDIFDTEETTVYNTSIHDQKYIDSLPIGNITWIEAIEYCNWLSMCEGRTPVYKLNLVETVSNNDHYIINWDRNANGYRLLTEAEWELAAKGGLDAIKKEWWKKINPLDYGQFAENTDGQTFQPIKGKKPNPLGIYDMLGNAEEWCWDWYSSESYVKSGNIDKGGIYGTVSDYRNNIIDSDFTDPHVTRGGSILNKTKGPIYYQDNKTMKLIQQTEPPNYFINRSLNGAFTRSWVGIRLARNDK